MNRLHSLLRSFIILLAFSLVLTACDSTEPEDDDGPGEEEVISNVTVTLEPAAGGDPVTAEAAFDETGVKQSAETLTLAAGATYNGMITLRDRFNDEDITEEIDEEREEHRFFYVIQGDVSDAVTVTIDDEDANGRPVGLQFTVTVADDASGSGELRVVLGHYDERPKQESETIDDIPETDIDFTYPVTVQ